MKISDDLTALVFELERARSPVEKGRAIARAWRTVRGLSATERRLLAREVGFDGAEDLVEGLAGKSGGTLAPAAVLEALGRMRKDESLSVRGILADLRDPERREDLLVRGIDLLAGDEIEEEDPVLELGLGFDPDEDEAPLEAPHPYSLAEVQSVDEADRLAAEPTDAEVEPESVDRIPPPPPSFEMTDPELREDHEPVADPDPEPDSPPPAESEDPESWEEMWHRTSTDSAAAAVVRRSRQTSRSGSAVPSRAASGSVLERLRGFRDGIDDLRGASDLTLINALDDFPELWARRRAVVALIESGIPGDPSSTLDLIAEMERPMDRRWCLSALARRGGLDGEDLERAMGMLSSPAARRRVRALAGAAGTSLD